MLTTIEKIIFIVLAITAAGFTFHGFKVIIDSIRKGRPAPELKDVPGSLVKAAIAVLLQQTIFKARKVLSAIHMGLFFGLITYAVVNLEDVLEGLVPGFELVYGGKYLSNAPTGLVNAFNLIADVMSGFLLIAITTFLVRRFIVKDRALTFRDNVLLNPKVKAGGQARDSLTVGVFVIMHVGARLMSQAFRLTDGADPFMPIASFLNSIFGTSETGVHVAWWISLGWVMFIIPYLSRSKHTHFFMSPVNLGLAKQNPRGQLDPAIPLKIIEGQKFDPGAKVIYDLAWTRVMDAYACVQCNRCQDVCPANFYQRPLSPSALEVNKRYLLKEATFGSHPEKLLLPLTETVISPEAIWSCTTCYACVRVCPVGNEPMADIIDIRRRMLIDGYEIDSGVQNALQSLATNGNWMSKGKRLRGRWAKEMDFPVKNATEEPVEHLWFVGDTASFDERVIPNTKMVARLFNQGGLDFGIMYQNESNAGNDVRRVGEEGPLGQLNATGITLHPPCELVATLQQSLHYGLLSHGAFDVTIKPMLDALQADRSPIEELKNLVDYRLLNVTDDEITLARPGMSVTLDGIAKGCVVDGGVATLREMGFENVLVEAGGDMMAKSMQDGEVWQVGITHPRAPKEMIAVISIQNQAVATSGDYMNYFNADYSTHHIVDPRTGRSPSQLASATVVASSVAEADALSTTMMVLGMQDGLALIESLPDASALLISKDLQMVRSRKFPIG